MTDFDDAVQIAQANQPTYTHTRIKVSGYKDPVTGEVGFDPTLNAQPGYMWVHGYPRGGNTQVIAGTTLNPYLANQRVYVGQNEAGQAVAYAPVIDQSSLRQFGAIQPALNQPSGVDEVLPRSILGLGFVPGRVEASQLGGLNLHIRSFWYIADNGADGYYDGDAIDGATGKPSLYDFDIAPYITAAADESQWVLISLDPQFGIPTVSVNAPVYGEPRVLSAVPDPDNPAAIDLSIIPHGTYPLGAVGVSGTMTEITGRSIFVDLRLHIASKGVNNTDWNRIVVDADGSVVTDADGNVVVIA